MAKPTSNPKDSPAGEECPSRFRPLWLTSALEAANQRGPYPKWVTGTAKAAVAIGLLTVVADWAAQRSARADLARLVSETSRVKPEATKTGSIRR